MGARVDVVGLVVVGRIVEGEVVGEVHGRRGEEEGETVRNAVGEAERAAV